MKPFTYRLTAEPLECDDLRIVGASLHEPMPAGLVHRPHGLGSYLLAIFHTDATVYQHSVSHLCPPAEPDPLGTGDLSALRQPVGRVGIFLGHLRWTLAAAHLDCAGAPLQCTNPAARDHRYRSFCTRIAWGIDTVFPPEPAGDPESRAESVPRNTTTTLFIRDSATIATMGYHQHAVYESAFCRVADASMNSRSRCIIRGYTLGDDLRRSSASLPWHS